MKLVDLALLCMLCPAQFLTNSNFTKNIAFLLSADKRFG